MSADNPTHRLPWLALLSLLLAVSASAQTNAQTSPDEAPYIVSGLTVPSAERELVFPRQGVIANVMVEEGDRVEAGMALIQLDSVLAESQVKEARIEAESTARVELDAERLEIAKIQLDRTVSMPETARTATELEEKQLEVSAAEAQLERTKEELEIAKVAYEQAMKVLDEHTLTTPIDGIVLSIESREGELAAGNEPACVVVDNTMLNVEVRSLTTRQVAKLKVGQTLQVRYDDDAEQWRDAKITFIAPKADMSSDTQFIRLKIDNEEGRASGLPVRVALPAELRENW